MLDFDALLSETRESPPCGSNLEHDLSFFGLEEAARGKPEQRIGNVVKAAEPPDWPKVVDLAQGLLLRTKDLRVAVHLTRALLRTKGVPGLASGLGVTHGLLQRYWDRIYPLLDADDNDDPTERLNALASLADPEQIVRDLRDTDLVNSREHGRLRARDVEVALGRLVPGESGSAATAKSLSQIHAQVAAAFAGDQTVPSGLRQARESALAIQTLIVERVGAARAIDTKPLVQSLENLLEVCDTAMGVRGAAADQAPGAAHPGINGEIASRQDAVRVLDLVCSYLERHEPSNPAPLFIRRAQRLMTKNFVEIVKDLLPDSLSNLERLAGEQEKK